MSRSHLEDFDKISVRSLKVDCIIGLHAHEKRQCQPLVIDVDFYLDTRIAAKSCRINHTADYSLIASEISFVLKHSRFKLIESAVEAISQLILSRQFLDQAAAPLEAVRVSMTKPVALDGWAVPSIDILRWKSDYSSLASKLNPGQHLIHETKESLLFKTVIAKGESFILPKDTSQDNIIYLVLSEGMASDRKNYRLHEELSRKDLEDRKIVNTGPEQSCLLTVVVKQDSIILDPV